MKHIFSSENFDIFLLTPALVKTYASEITKTLDQIPLTASHTLEKNLAIKKDNRILHAKWEHSLIAVSKNEQFAGILISYERDAEKNDQYPMNSIHLKSIAVSPPFQKLGLGKLLIKTWLEYNEKIGFLKLDGDLAFSVQTNSAEWNAHVQNLYTSFGFKEISKKQYDNRIDTIYWLDGKAEK